MLKKGFKYYYCPIIIGAILIIIGLAVHIPGAALTTYESLDGKHTDNYVWDDKYSSIDEYVGGDAYNYIIGATLVAAKISGTIAAKAVFIVGGFICICFGLTLILLKKEKDADNKTSVNDTDFETPASAIGVSSQAPDINPLSDSLNQETPEL